MKLKIALEWFLNPDHLPIIAGIGMGKYKEADIEIELIEPNEHYDGFDLLKNGEIDIHINEPIHLFEHYFDGIKSLGAYFETQGGFIIKEESINKLKENKLLHITTPAANDITNKIGFEILNRYAIKENFKIDKENIKFIETDFYHIKNLQKSDFDGAWLCFYNFEVIEANHLGLKHLFIDHIKSPYPNFSALEIITSENILKEKHGYIDKFIAVTNEMIRYLSKNDNLAKSIYYDYTQAEHSQIMDKIISDTLSRFFYIKKDSNRWKMLYDFLNKLEIIKLTQKQYNLIWE